jgi:tetratricopeptide (TPR) repeat protein
MEAKPRNMAVSYGYHDDIAITHKLVLGLAEEVGDQEALALTHNYLAATYYRLGRWHEAFLHIDQAIAIREQLGDRVGQATSIVNRGRVLVSCGRYPDALESFQKALSIYLEADAPLVTIGDTYTCIGVAHLFLGHHDAAQQCFDRHLELALTTGLPYEIAVARAHIGKLDLHRGRFETALDLLERAEVARADPEVATHAETTCDIGCAHRGLGNLDQAQRYHREALAMMEECGDLCGEGDVRIELGVTLHLAGHDKEAIEQLQRALDIAEQFQVPPQAARALDGLADVLASTDPVTADNLRKRADTINQELGVPRPSTTPTPT